MANGFDDFAEGFASTFAPTFSKAYQSSVDRHDDLIKNNMTSWNSKYEKYLEAEKTNASSLKQAKSLAAQFNQPESAIPDIAYQIQMLGADKVYDDFKEGFTFQPVKPESNDVNNVTAPVADDANATSNQETPSSSDQTMSVRNNNPGNLKFAGQAGATEGDGGFAVFETAEAGMSAMRRQIELDTQERGMTLSEFINKYAPPGDNNDTPAYIKTIADAVGIGANDTIPADKIDAVQNIMIKVEGGAEASDFFSSTSNKVDSRPDNTSTDNQMADGALGDGIKTDDGTGDTGDTDEQTEETFFGRLRREAGEKYTDRVRNETIANLGVGEDVYDKVLAGYTSDITPSGKFTLTSPVKAADYKTVYTATGGVQTFNTSTAEGRTGYQEAVDGGGTPISKPSLSALESMNEGQKYVKPDYVTFYDAKTNTYQQVNVATEDGGTKAAGLVEKGYRQVKDPSVQELETAGFNIDISSLKTYGAAFAASEHLKALETSGVQVPDEVVSGVNNVLTELKPEDTTKKPEWVAVRIGDGPTRYYDENNPDDVKTLREAQDKARGNKETIRFFNISTEPKDDEFKAPEWTGTKSSYHSILHRANTNSEVEGPVGDWARKWLKNEKDSIERMVDKPESITEAFIKSEYTRLFQAAQGKGPDSEEAKAFNAFKQNTLPGYLEIHSQLNPDKPLTFAQELARLNEMENASPGTFTDDQIAAQRTKTDNLLIAQTVEGIAEDEAGKSVRIVNEQDGQYINATQIVSTDGTISYKMPDGSTATGNTHRVVADREVEDAAQAVSRTSTDRRAYNDNLTTAVGAVSLGGEVVELVNRDKRALTFAGRRIATMLSSGAREADAISSIIGGYFEGQPEDATITLAEAENLLRQNGVLSGDQTFQSLLSQDTTDLASVANQLEAKTFLMAFRAGGLEGQSGQAMSNRDFDRLLKIIRNSTDEATFKTGIVDYLNDRVQAVNTGFNNLNQNADLRIFKENYGYSPLRGSDLVRSWQDVSTDVNDARLMRSLDILGMDPNRPPLQAYQLLQNNPNFAPQFAEKYGEQYLPFAMRGTDGDE